MKVGVFVTAGKQNFYSAISSSLRTLEEVDVEELLLVHTQRAEDNAKALKDMLLKVFNRVKNVTVSGDDAPWKERFNEIKSLEIDLAVISPAGTSLSSLVTKAFETTAHVSFPFSLWWGLTYPFVPRFLQRFNTLNGSEGDKIHLNVAGKIMSGGMAEKLLDTVGERGPIKREVALNVLKMNSHYSKPCRDVCERPELKFEIKYSTNGKVDPKDRNSWKNAATLWSVTLADNPPKDLLKSANNALNRINQLMSTGILERGSDSVLWLSGILPIDMEPEGISSPLIADTSALYLGILNTPYTVKIPRCALYELLHKYEERAKRTVKYVNLIGLISKVLFEEVKARGFLHPSPPDLCDKALLQIDPLLLEGYAIATEDVGIEMMWKGSPMEKLAKLVKVKRLQNETKYYNEPYAYYAAFQLFSIFKLIDKELNKLYGTKGSIRFSGKAYVNNQVFSSF